MGRLREVIRGKGSIEVGVVREEREGVEVEVGVLRGEVASWEGGEVGREGSRHQSESSGCRKGKDGNA